MLIKLAALWLRQDKNGNSFMSGKLNETCDVLIFANRKTKDSQPDYILHLKAIEPRQEPKPYLNGSKPSNKTGSLLTPDKPCPPFDTHALEDTEQL